MAKEQKSAPEPYKVLVLKYRPQLFSDIIGQDHIKTALTSAIKKNKVAHSFMFAGSRGTGKTTSARLLAKALNCLSSDGPTPEPCGTCAACTEIADSKDMDVLEIDGASNNGVEQIRELRSTIESRPARDRFRVIIIDEVHMLSIAAFNALLKTLEEPPEHVKFIFATTDPHKVPETIHSRCQHYDFRRLSSDQIVDSLAKISKIEELTVEDGVFSTIARISEGGLRDAQSKLDQLIAFRGTEIKLADLEEVFGLVGRKRMLEMVGGFREGRVDDVLKIVDEVFTQGKDLSNFVVGLVGTMRDLLVVRASGQDTPVLDLMPDERKALGEEAKHWEAQTLIYGLEFLNELVQRLKSSDFPRILLESCVIKLCDLQSLRPVRDVVMALDDVLRGRVALEVGGGDSPKKA